MRADAALCLLGSLLAAACSRPAPPADDAERRKKAFLAALRTEFETTCVDGAVQRMRALGRPDDEKGARAACDCIGPSLEAAGLLQPPPGADLFNEKVRAREAARAFLKSEAGKKAVAKCVIR